MLKRTRINVTLYVNCRYRLLSNGYWALSSYWSSCRVSTTYDHLVRRL